MKIYIIIMITLILGCNQQNITQAAKKGETIIVLKDTVKPNLNSLVFAVNKDLVCGMPISAGVIDTAHYKVKIYAFCAVECKDEFVKDPVLYITAGQ